MAYVYDRTSGRIKTSEAVSAYSGKGLAEASKSLKRYIPPYKVAIGRAKYSVAESVAYHKAIYNPATNPAPVHLVRGATDLLLFRGLTTAGIIGTCLSLYSIYLIATNKMQRKQT